MEFLETTNNVCIEFINIDSALIKSIEILGISSTTCRVLFSHINTANEVQIVQK